MGAAAAVRAMRPAFRVRSLAHGDAQGLMTFRGVLSADTVYNRYFAPERLSQHETRAWVEGLLSRHRCRQLTWVATNAAQGVIGVLELAPDP